MSGQLQLLPAGPPSIREAHLPLDRLTGWEHARPGKLLIEQVNCYQRLLEPITVMRADACTYRFGDGRRRVKAIATLAERGEWRAPVRVPALIIAGPECDRLAAAGLTLAKHASRSASPASELAAIETILNAGGKVGEQVTIAQIAVQTGFSQQTIRRRLRLRSLIDPLRNLFDQGQLTPTVAEALARLPSGQQHQLSESSTNGEPLTLQAVRNTTRERTAESVTKLPGSLFTDREPSWRVGVLGHLRAALDGLPENAQQQLMGAIETALLLAEEAIPAA